MPFYAFFPAHIIYSINRICIHYYLCDTAIAEKSKFYVAIAKTTTLIISANVIKWLKTLHAAYLTDNDHMSYLTFVKRHVMQDDFI